MTAGRQPPARLGLRENWPQFALLVVVNAGVGGMVGLERTVVPLIGARELGVTSQTLVLSFIAVFGAAKAVTNFGSGVLAERLTRKTTLVAGWAVGLPVPFVLAYAPGWSWIVAANVLLGVNQGLTWSMTVNMKIDLVGPTRRGLATGLNEAAGYVGVGATALFTGFLAARYGLRPTPELLGVAYAAAGLALSALLVRDTADHVAAEAAQHPAPARDTPGAWWAWRDRSLFGVSQAGLVNNLNDAITWGVFPLLYAAHGLGLGQIGVIKAVYPVVWGLGQVLTGHLADRLGRKPLIVGGMLAQAAAFVIVLAGLTAYPWVTGLGGSALLGIGTAMVYPALIAAASDAAHPTWRSLALGTYRFWRDLGYALGAVVAGLIADTVGLAATVVAAAVLTAGAGLVAWRTLGRPHRGNVPLTPAAAAHAAGPEARGGSGRPDGRRRRPPRRP